MFLSCVCMLKCLLFSFALAFVLWNGIVWHVTSWILLVLGETVFLRFVFVVGAPGVGAFAWLYTIPWFEDIAVCWLVLVNMWVVSRELLQSVLLETFLAMPLSPRKGIAEFKTDLGRGEIQSGTCTRLNWGFHGPWADLVLEEGYTQHLEGLLELECAISHLSNSAAEVSVLGLGTRVEPSPLCASKEAEALFVTGTTAPTF